MASDASYENTSTTSCMSDSGSVHCPHQTSNKHNCLLNASDIEDDDDNGSYFNAHIGEIDEGRVFVPRGPPTSTRSMSSDPTNLQYYVLNNNNSSNYDSNYELSSHEDQYNQTHSARHWYRQEGVNAATTTTNGVNSAISDTGSSNYNIKIYNGQGEPTWYYDHGGDDDSSIMVDSVMEGIRNEIWEQVHQAKMKHRNRRVTRSSQKEPSNENSSNNTSFSRNQHSRRDPDGRRLDTPFDLDEYNDTPEQTETSTDSDEEYDGFITCADQQNIVDLESVAPASTIFNMTNELITSDDDANSAPSDSAPAPDSPDDDFASVKYVRDSIALLRTARAFTRSRDDSSSLMVQLEPQPQQQQQNKNAVSFLRNSRRQTARKGPALTMAPSDEVWDVQDDIDSLIIDKEDIAVTEARVAPATPITSAVPAIPATQATQQMQDSEVDSLFDSILAIELEEKKADMQIAETKKSMQKSKTKSKAKHVTRPKDPPELKKTAVADAFVRASVHGSKEETILYIPVFYIEQREMEMKERAMAAGIGDDQWNGSLLGQKVLSNKKHQPRLMTLELHPEILCAEANYSQTFEWQPWLNECIESFYKTNSMHVPDFCVGPDLLVALQYFGILYKPDQLLFDSFSTYLRVKLWSEYFTHRGTIAEWIANKLYQSHAKHTHIYSTYPNPIKKGTFVDIGNRRAELFDGGILLDKKIYGDTSSSTVLFSFFNEEDNDDNEVSSGMDTLMRADFCNYFKKLMPGISVSFPMKTSTIRHANGSSEMVRLATLYIRLQSPRPNENRDLFHIEEDNSIVSETTRNSPPMALTSILNTCRNRNTSSLQQCFLNTKTKLFDFDSTPRSSWANPDGWLPVQSPESASAFSVDDCKDSKVFDGWMSISAKQDNTFFDDKTPDGTAADDWWKESLPPPTPPEKNETMKMPSARKQIKNLIDSESEMSSQVEPAKLEKRQQVKNLIDTESDSSHFQQEPQHGEIKMNIDHIYEDLWLQETAFDDSLWARSDSGVKGTTAKKASKKEAKGAKQTKSRESSMGSAKQKKKRTKKKGRPNHLLCDAVGMFEDSSVGSRSHSAPRRRPGSKPVPGIDFPDDEDIF